VRFSQSLKFALAGALFFNVLPIALQAASSTPSSNVAADSAIRAAVAALNPQLKITSIENSKIPGLKQVVVGSEVLYFSSDGKHLIQGTMYEAGTRRNLTDDALAGMRLQALKQVGARDMIVFPAKGAKRYAVKVITDIDCGVCRKLHSELAQFSDAGIEIQYILAPRAGVDSDSARKAVAVYCAASPSASLTAAKSGVDPGHASCPNPVSRNVALARLLNITGTPTMFFPDGGSSPGYLPAPQLLAELDRRANAQSKALSP
jgi:thiol:disulfide interchange protein DsbC